MLPLNLTRSSSFVYNLLADLVLSWWRLIRPLEEATDAQSPPCCSHKRKRSPRGTVVSVLANSLMTSCGGGLLVLVAALTNRPYAAFAAVVDLHSGSFMSMAGKSFGSSEPPAVAATSAPRESPTAVPWSGAAFGGGCGTGTAAELLAFGGGAISTFATVCSAFGTLGALLCSGIEGVVDTKADESA